MAVTIWQYDSAVVDGYVASTFWITVNDDSASRRICDRCARGAAHQAREGTQSTAARAAGGDCTRPRMVKTLLSDLRLALISGGKYGLRTKCLHKRAPRPDQRSSQVAFASFLSRALLPAIRDQQGEALLVAHLALVQVAVRLGLLQPKCRTVTKTPNEPVSVNQGRSQKQKRAKDQDSVRASFWQARIAESRDQGP